MIGGKKRHAEVYTVPRKECLCMDHRTISTYSPSLMASDLVEQKENWKKGFFL